MKRAFVLALVALACVTGIAGAATVGIGAFGGVSVPVVQDDNGQGTVFGIRAPVSLLPLITIEPYFLSGSGGDKDQDLGGGTTITRSGIDVTGFGANAMLTIGGPFSFYPFVGIGSHKLERTGLDETRTTYNFGLGIRISPMPKLGVHVRGELNAAVQDDASRKWGTVTAGVSYDLVSFPPTP
jgi:hypothetical protein